MKGIVMTALWKIIVLLVIVLVALFVILAPWYLPYILSLGENRIIQQVRSMKFMLEETTRMRSWISGNQFEFPKDYFMIQIYGSDECFSYLESMYIKGKFLGKEDPFLCNNSFCICIAKFHNICEKKCIPLWSISPSLPIIPFPVCFDVCPINWSSTYPTWLEMDFHARFYDKIAYNNETPSPQNLLSDLCVDFFNGTKIQVDGKLKSFGNDYIESIRCLPTPKVSEDDKTISYYLSIDNDECLFKECGDNIVLWIHTNESQSFKILGAKLQDLSEFYTGSISTILMDPIIKSY